MASRMLWISCGMLCFHLISALDNGQALTPPMGWLAWERFHCNTDCERYPNDCISEKLFIQMADRLVKDGFRDVGYKFVNIDDCWMAKKRNSDGRLIADPVRFPHGIKFLANYMHKRGLKLGIYEDFGIKTCMNYPGSVGHMELDAQTFAEWEVDMLKFDGCHSHFKDMDVGYTLMGKHLNRTGRHIVYSCSWPYYQLLNNMEPNYTKVSEHCNLWRNYDDIKDSWDSVQNIITFYGDNQEVLVPHAGPGHWNDPDMLVIGNFGLNYEQAKCQMGMWSIFAAPLLMSNDLRKLQPQFRKILLNKDVIAVDQDPLGIQGKRVFKAKDIEIWLRPISPSKGSEYSYAVAFLNLQDGTLPTGVQVTLQELGMTYPGGYYIKDLFSGTERGVFKPRDHISVLVNPTGIVLLRATLED